ncbi:MAG: hypothetical protein LBL35_03640 [Clostridiales bacterium]|nr:hypothetical protein [Clostridiales bacterium]
MIDFREEIAKYKPIMEMEDVEASIQSEETRDIMDLLQYITKRLSA